jgi:hypothetical protein
MGIFGFITLYGFKHPGNEYFSSFIVLSVFAACALWFVGSELFYQALRLSIRCMQRPTIISNLLESPLVFGFKRKMTQNPSTLHSSFFFYKMKFTTSILSILVVLSATASSNDHGYGCSSSEDGKGKCRMSPLAYHLIEASLHTSQQKATYQPCNL